MPARLSLIIPTYNERDRLSELVDTTFAALRGAGIDAELVIVDDRSPDGTGALADDLARRYPIRVVHRSGKLGLGTAVIDGFNAAAHDVLGVMDADLSHPPAALAAMVTVLETSGADFVIGSRYIPGGGTGNWSWMRAWLSRAACVLARPLTPVRDATSGFFLLRREVIEGVQIEAGGFKICLELLTRGHARAVAEVPYVFANRTAGASKMNLREALGYLRQLWQLLRWRSRSAAPRPTYRQVSAPRKAPFTP
jgi:dolichol-phosphate mannosyltransferase